MKNAGDHAVDKFEIFFNDDLLEFIVAHSVFYA